jgi:hypothetical protein
MARPPGARIATRIVLDDELKLPVGKQLAKTASQIPTLIAHSSMDVNRIQALADAGCECFYLLPATRSEMAKQLLSELGRRKMTNVLVEGDFQNGPRTMAQGNDGDRHLIVWDQDTNIAYEYYQYYRPAEVNPWGTQGDGKAHGSRVRCSQAARFQQRRRRQRAFLAQVR